MEGNFYNGEDLVEHKINISTDNITDAELQNMESELENQEIFDLAKENQVIAEDQNEDKDSLDNDNIFNNVDNKQNDNFPPRKSNQEIMIELMEEKISEVEAEFEEERVKLKSDKKSLEQLVKKLSDENLMLIQNFEEIYNDHTNLKEENGTLKAELQKAPKNNLMDANL